MTNNIKWKVIQFSLGHHPNNLILVGYKSRGTGLNEVQAVSPLYDLRDMNLDGSVSYTEKIWNFLTDLKDFDDVFAFMKAAGKMSCVLEAATQLNDPFLYAAATQETLQQVLDIGLKSVMPEAIQSLVVDPIQKAAVQTGLSNANNVYGGALFLFKIGMGANIQQNLNSLKSQRNLNGVVVGQ